MLVTRSQPDSGQTMKVIRKMIREARRENRKPKLLSLGRVQFDDMWDSAVLVYRMDVGHVGVDAAWNTVMTQPMGESFVHGVPVRWSAGNVLSLASGDA